MFFIIQKYLHLKNMTDRSLDSFQYIQQELLESLKGCQNRCLDRIMTRFQHIRTLWIENESALERRKTHFCLIITLTLYKMN